MTIVQRVSRAVRDNSPAILTAVAISGVLGIAIVSAKAGYRAGIADSQSKTPPETLKERFVEHWRKFVPSAVIGGVAIGSVIGMNSVHSRRTAAVMSAFTLADKSLKEYTAKVVEKIGDKAEREIRDEIAKEDLATVPMYQSHVIDTHLGESYIYDSLSGRYFRGDIELVRKAVNDINAECLEFGYASHNDFYDKIGLPKVVLGEELGWNINNRMELNYSSQIVDNKPMFYLEYVVFPAKKYYRHD